jgi:hypothetical protein
MYNMDISIFGYKLNVEILILIGIVYLILVGHTVCGCCNMRGIEGFEDSGNVAENVKKAKSTEVKAKANLLTQKAAGSTSEPTTTSSVSTTTTEGFTGANINYGESSLYDLNDDTAVNTSSWNAPDMTVVPGQPLSAGVKAFLSRKPQPIPLPEGEMLMFAETPFKPECCPNTYSNSSGCACMTGDQYNYLIVRGGNNVPYSQY